MVAHRSSGEPRVLSLDQDAVSEGGLTVLDRLACSRSPSPEDEADRHRVRSLVRREVALLSERQRVIIENRFGLDGRPAMTFQELGQMLGLSRERARQIEEEAMARLRRRLAKATGKSPNRGQLP
jgi:RNA polymerase nonessential primary-like sigma factor